MNDFTVEVKGLDALSKKLKLLPERFASRGMRRALRRGANVIRDAARNNAKRFDDPKTSNAIYKNIVVQGGGRRLERQNGGPLMRVGVLGGARDYSAYGEIKTGRSGRLNPGGDTWYWRFLEFGTSEHAAKPFLRPALASSAEQALSVIVSSASDELDKELNKL
ncbi:hypothetical protein [Stenotrophomonas phage SOVA965]